MSSVRFAILIALIACSFATSGYSQGGGSPRQYYSSWQKHPQKSYHYRKFYYKPSPTHVGYKHHYAIHHPSRPKHTYFYNPYKKVYWGRCDATGRGDGKYSLLPEAARKPLLSSIPDSDFPEAGELPALPDSTDGALLDLPPDDLPGDVDTAADK
jgi:hypothetical protein